MNRLEDVPAAALVESRFSTVTLVKSNYRMAIGADKILGFIMMRDEPKFHEVRSLFTARIHWRLLRI